MMIANGKIIRCTDAELFEHWLKHFENIFPYEVYKAACVSKGTEVVSNDFVPECKQYRTRYCYDECNWFGKCLDFEREVE